MLVACKQRYTQEGHDDRTQGNTAGLGGLFGFLWFVGKAPPAPEYQPFKKSWQFELLEKLGPLLTKLQAAAPQK